MTAIRAACTLAVRLTSINEGITRIQPAAPVAVIDLGFPAFFADHTLFDVPPEKPFEQATQKSEIGLTRRFKIQERSEQSASRRKIRAAKP
jgi:hypothetical protein